MTCAYSVLGQFFWLVEYLFVFSARVNMAKSAWKNMLLRFSPCLFKRSVFTAKVEGQTW